MTLETRRQTGLLAGILFSILCGPVSAADDGDRFSEGRGLIDGRALYQQLCADCHGPRGRGAAHRTPDFSDPQALVRLDSETIAATVSERHADRVPEAPAQPELDLIAAYIRDYLMLPAPGADTALGREVYAETCSVCHGDRGNAASWARNSLNPPPADFTARSASDLPRDDMIHTVTFGSENTAMKGFATQLSPGQIAAAVDYIREAFMQSEAEVAAAGDDRDAAQDQSQTGMHVASYPDQIEGNAAWGKAFYNANCAECHGRDGDGEGPRAYFMIRKPASFRTAEARDRLDRPRLFDAIAHGVRGSTMPAWQTVLKPKQIANVSEYVFTNFLNPPASGDTVDPPGWRRTTGGSKKN